MSYSLTQPRRVMTLLALILLPLSAVAAMTGTQQAEAASKLCAIKATSAAGTVTLEALVNADKRVSGSYSFRIEQSGRSGSSSINQGGDFDAAPGQPAHLGTVSLGSSGAGYKAVLDLLIGGKSVRCTKQIDAI